MHSVLLHPQQMVRRNKSICKPKDPEKHKTADKQVRVRSALYGRCEIAAFADATDTTEVINTFVREGLERRGLWLHMTDDWKAIEAEMKRVAEPEPEPKPKKK